MGELRWSFFFIASIKKKKSEGKFICHSSSFSIFPLSSRKDRKDKHHPIFPHQNKGLINYVFCRNWPVRNPAGTRQDSSRLVNKQVAVTLLYFTLELSVKISFLHKIFIYFFYFFVKFLSKNFCPCNLGSKYYTYCTLIPSTAT